MEQQKKEEISKVSKGMYKKMYENILKEKEKLKDVKGAKKYIKKKLKVLDSIFND